MRLKQFVIPIILLSLLIGMVGACQSSYQPGAIVDDLGRQISLDKAPQRIVSHVPGITEMLFALGLDEKVVGVSDYCDYPEAAKLKPKIGGFWKPSMEKIVELDPDLIFTNGFEELLMTQLDELGIIYIVLQPEDIDGILKNIELVGKITGIESRAEELVENMQVRMSYIAERVSDAPRPRVFYAYAVTDLNNPWTAGSGSFGDSLISMAGGENIGAKALVPWPQFSIEEVANSDPEVIIVNVKHGTAVTPIEEMRRHPVWRETTAIKHDRIYTIDGNLIERSGPRIVQGLEEMAQIIHPELFE